MSQVYVGFGSAVRAIHYFSPRVTSSCPRFIVNCMRGKLHHFFYMRYIDDCSTVILAFIDDSQVEELSAHRHRSFKPSVVFILREIINFAIIIYVGQLSSWLLNHKIFIIILFSCLFLRCCISKVSMLFFELIKHGILIGCFVSWHEEVFRPDVVHCEHFIVDNYF